MIHLDSPDDPRLVDYTDLTDVALRRVREPAEGLFIAESTQVIRRALAAGHRPRSLLVAPRWLPDITDVTDACERSGAEVYVAEEPVLEAITGFHVHRGAIASMHRPTLAPVAELLREARTVVVLEDIVDHTNTGAVFRSAAGLGVDAVLVTPRCADPLYRRSVRVSMGTVFQVPWTRIEPWPAGITQLQDAGFHVAALALSDDSVPLQNFAAKRPDKLALLLGTEGAGLTPASVAAADTVVRIPMHGGVDSLNVAAASAVAFWALGSDCTPSPGA
ncbi:tRNA G18 (ribose-2'-O)-methylase SpoU [Quadrisphaera granulorum]|uniref:tRNA G18 (Ribose-2'-O)-methylase SpoU n=1 Tax=Quadrisphaera granulorum TaxID=317664 RepID=A0A315ZJB8_9ACTN|nr:RNA methyltransferase [Quadrisphaera granulorum]PWJ45160.1 tRNA G18 (ribose-2'-O)-methylase SpoU [Quadrisphaera granulorum]SZE99184.1 tRNA G18 (ribose-2'-O)-methylase SpoU [Quadrisphaera granulorum]